MRTLIAVLVKELIQIRRDPKMLPMILVAPVLQLLVFGLAANRDVTAIPAVIVDQDATAVSRSFVAGLEGARTLVRTETARTGPEAERHLAAGTAQLALVIARRARATDPLRVQLLVDGSDAAAASVAIAHVELAARHPRAFALATTVLFNPELRSRWHFVPAVLAMVLLVLTMVVAAISIVREVELGTHEQVAVTPIRPYQLVLGKLAPFALIGMAEVPFVCAVTVHGLGVPLRGSIVTLAGFTALYLLSTLSLGLLISTAVRAQRHAIMLAFTLMVPLLDLSGLIFPIETMPAAVQVLTLLNPVRHYNEAVRAIFVKGAGLADLTTEALALAALGGALLALAVSRVHKRAE